MNGDADKYILYVLVLYIILFIFGLVIAFSGGTWMLIGGALSFGSFWYIVFTLLGQRGSESGGRV